MTDINQSAAKAEQLQAKQHLPKGLCMVSVTSDCPKHGVITRQVVNIIADKARQTCPVCQAEQDESERLARLAQKRIKQAKVSGISHYQPFDTWQVANERMANILSFVQGYAQNPQGNLIFSGKTGTGKTMLANLIATHAINHEKDVLVLRSSQICEQARATWHKYAQTTEQALIERWTGVDLLVIDEFGEADMATNADMAQADRERMSRIIDGRYSRQLPTIITTNLTKDELIQRLGDRAWDRLQQSCVYITFDWQSYRQEHSSFLEI